MSARAVLNDNGCMDRDEEVAQLTGMSVDYYSRIAQARSTQPSPQMLRALARALAVVGDQAVGQPGG
jgi:transcriptional regulator with XRE-family HTH domain